MLFIKAIYCSVHFLFICSHCAVTLLVDNHLNLSRNEIKIKINSLLCFYEYTCLKAQKEKLKLEGIESIFFNQIWLFSCLLAMAKYLASNQNNESRASVFRGFHLNKQGNFHFKYMFCHAFTKQ